MFTNASENSVTEMDARRGAKKNLLNFGISFLDDALLGILPNDLILIGAPSGIGKTQLCCGISLANLEAGKRVHYIALEAERHEIERRLKYQIFADIYYQAAPRLGLTKRISYDEWVLGEYLEEFADIEQGVTEFFAKGFKNLFVYYKNGDFGLPQLIELVTRNASKTDLIIVDHVHYFDFEDDNENRAIRDIAKTARALALEEGKPIILVSHLRKRDRGNQELAPGIDEFHGSSDLTKIATKVVTLAPGDMHADGTFETFFRVSKNRVNGSVTRFLGRTFFDPRTNRYEKIYRIGRANLTRETGFEELEDRLYPRWAKRNGGGSSNPNAEGPAITTPFTRRA